MNTSSVQSALEKFSREVVEKAKKNLPNGKLQKSIRSELEVNQNSFSLSFFMEDYGQFQDQGVSGTEKKYNTSFSYTNKRPPAKAFDKWIVKRGLAPRNTKGAFQNRKSLQFALSNHIFKQGIKPKRFFREPFEQELKELPEEIVTAYGLDIESFIKFTLKA